MFHQMKIVQKPAALIHQNRRIVISKKKVGVLNKVLLLSSITTTNIIYGSAVFDILVQYIFKYSIINFIFPLSPFYFSHDHLTTVTITPLPSSPLYHPSLPLPCIITLIPSSPLPITITTLTNTTLTALSPSHYHEHNHHHYCTITTIHHLQHHILLFHFHS